jgi:CRP-like cAMP-binding protein
MDFIDLVGPLKTIRSMGPKEILFREGDAGSEMYVVLEGAASILIGQAIIEIARPGAIIGEMALIDEGDRSATVVTRTPCKLLCLTAPDFDLLVREHPEFARQVMRVIVERLRRMNTTFLRRRLESGG